MNALSPSIIVALQSSVSAHWTAIQTYTSEAIHFARWGYSKLAAKAQADVVEETKHLNRLLDRLEDFDASTIFDIKAPEIPRHDFTGILTANLSLEQSAAEIERNGITTARASGDEVTALLLGKNLKGSEQSIVEIEAVLRNVNEIGVQTYLSTQL